MTGKKKIEKLFTIAKQHGIVIDLLADDEWNELDNLAFDAYVTDNWQQVENFMRRIANGNVTVI